MSNPFVVPHGDYQRSGHYLSHYVEQSVIYLMRTEGASEEEAREFVAEEIKNGRDPNVQVLVRDEDTGDRSPEIMKWSHFNRACHEEKLIVAPNLACNVSQNVRRSITGRYIVKNLAVRQSQKSEMFRYDMLRDVERASFYKNAQTSTKYKNNSLSGAHQSAGNVLHNSSAHSQLTSTCRTGTSIANAHNERFIRGNRFYTNPDLVDAQVVSLLQVIDRAAVRKAIDKYNLHIPTDQDILACMALSADLYFPVREHHAEQWLKIIRTLSDEERCAFLYTGDLYHLELHNPEVVRKILTDLSTRSQVPTQGDPKQILKEVHGDIVIHASLLCGELIAGKQLYKVAETDPEAYGIVAATAEQVQAVVFDLKEMSDAFWLTKWAPNNISQMAHQRRKVVPISDTDSTIFTTQYWTTKMVGKLDFSQASKDFGASVTFLSAQIVRHWLLTIMANLGVPEEFRYTLSMKNEFFMPILALTQVAKHYAYLSLAQEGNVFTKPKLDVKGVNLRHSKWPAQVRKAHEDWVMGIFLKIMEQGQVSIHDLLVGAYNAEKALLDASEAGSHEYMSTVRINPKEAYRTETSNYTHWEMWCEVFEPKYGAGAPPPNVAIAVPVKLQKKLQTKAWLDSIEDRALASRLEAFMKRIGRDTWTNFYLPADIVVTNGIPAEFRSVIDNRKIISSTLGGFYLFMSTFGIHLKDDKMARFITDEYCPPIGA